MMLQQKLMLVAIISTVIAGAALVARRTSGAPAPVLPLSRSTGLVAAWLAVVAVALVLVGIASDTLLRHLVQIAPLGLALIVVLRHSSWGISAAAPLFAFWLLLMIGIWLFLLGLARIFPGTFTPPGDRAHGGHRHRVGARTPSSLSAGRIRPDARGRSRSLRRSVALLQFVAMLASISAVAQLTRGALSDDLLPDHPNG